MSRLYLILIGSACFALGLGVQALFEVEDLARFLRNNMWLILRAALIGLVLIGLTLLIGYLLLIHKLRQQLNSTQDMDAPEIVAALYDTLTTPEGVSKPTAQDRRRAAIVNIGAWVLRREGRLFYFNVTVAVLGGMIGSATLFLLYEQNRKLDIQNRQITLQTDAAIVQSILLESTRRTTLAVVNQTLFDAIADAPAVTDANCPDEGPKVSCWETVDGARWFHLPLELRTQAETLAQRSTPYYLAEPRDSGGGLDFGNPLSRQFNFRALSPERGQLLETLVTNRVVVPRSVYNFALLYDANLQGAVLRGLELNVSDFRDTDLGDADLSGSRFQEANFIGATLRNTQMIEADLQGTALSPRSFLGTHVSAANFTGATTHQGLPGHAWAWRDMPPNNLPQAIDLTLCTFDPARHDRQKRPIDC